MNWENKMVKQKLDGEWKMKNEQREDHKGLGEEN